MSVVALEDIQETVRAHVAAEILCEAVSDGTGRIACVMPLQYSSGDSITIWVEQLGDRFRVSDYGECFLPVIARKRRDVRDMEAAASATARLWGVEVKGGSLIAYTDAGGLGEAVWRVTTAAYTVEKAAERFRPTQRHHDRNHRVFTREVVKELDARDLPVEERVPVEGQSGHEHRATIFVPSSQSIVEPIDWRGHYSQISAVYTKFGDLKKRNNFQRLSLVDDRHGRLSDDLASMLVQVSDVVSWTRRDEWLPQRLT